MEVVDIQSSSGTCSPDHEIGLDSNRLLAGSYTILNGEIRLDSEGPGSQGDHTEHSVSVETKKVPPPVPPKPNRPTVPSAGYAYCLRGIKLLLYFKLSFSNLFKRNNSVVYQSLQKTICFLWLNCL